ncbi:Protein STRICTOSIDINE SYNTHASE-LIKE 3 [Bienertia sinuspersici]
MSITAFATCIVIAVLDFRSVCEPQPSPLAYAKQIWLKGEKVGTSESFAILPGFPDNVRTNKEGDFWVALHCRRSWANHLLATPRN